MKETKGELDLMADIWGMLEPAPPDMRDRVLTWVNQKSQSHSIFQSVESLSRMKMPEGGALGKP